MLTDQEIFAWVLRAFGTLAAVWRATSAFDHALFVIVVLALVFVGPRLGDALERRAPR